MGRILESRKTNDEILRRKRYSGQNQAVGKSQGLGIIATGKIQVAASMTP